MTDGAGGQTGSLDLLSATPREALRAETRDLHIVLDETLAGPGGRVSGPSDYARLVGVLHDLHAHVDRPLASWASRTRALPGGLRTPDRAALYARDVAAVGGRVHRVAEAGAGGEGEALGRLYLVAGSAAGARVLLRGLPASVPAAARAGLSDAAETGSTRLWRATCALLEAPRPAPVVREAVAEARRLMDWLLARPGVVVR